MTDAMKQKLVAMLTLALLGSAAHADAFTDFQATVDLTWNAAALQAGAVGMSADRSLALMPGKSIGAACLGSQITDCGQWWVKLQQIATLTGWTVTEHDGKIDEATWNKQLTRAAAAGHYGILTFGVIPSISGQGLDAIAAKRLPVAGMTSDNPEGVSIFATRLDGGIRQDNFDVGSLQGAASGVQLFKAQLGLPKVGSDPLFSGLTTVFFSAAAFKPGNDNKRRSSL